MSKQPLHKINVRFPPGMLDELRPLAEQDFRSLNGEIVHAIREFIARRKGASPDARQTLQGPTTAQEPQA